MFNIHEYIGQNFKHPKGFGGKIATFFMNIQNSKQYKSIIDNIDIQPTDTVLDIGFGNGYLLNRLLTLQPHKMIGIDISRDMISYVSKKHQDKVNKGKLNLYLADVHNLPLDNGSIDKAYSVNTVYFWQDIHKVFSEIQRVLKTGGLFLNVLYLQEWLDKLPASKHGYTKFTMDSIKNITNESGLKIEQIIEIQHKKSICIISIKG